MPRNKETAAVANVPETLAVAAEPVETAVVTDEPIRPLFTAAEQTNTWSVVTFRDGSQLHVFRSPMGIFTALAEARRHGASVAAEAVPHVKGTGRGGAVIGDHEVVSIDSREVVSVR